MKTRLIANPAAGQGRMGELLPPVVERLRGMGHLVEVAHTSREGDGIRLAQEAVDQGCELIIAGGGT